MDAGAGDLEGDGQGAALQLCGEFLGEGAGEIAEDLGYPPVIGAAAMSGAELTEPSTTTAT